MEFSAKFCAIYEKIMGGSSLTHQEITDILHCLANRLNCVATACDPDEHPDDAILLLFSIITTASIRHMWPDDAGNTIANLTNFNILRNFLDNEDMLVSYSCSRALAQIFKNVLQLDCVEYYLEMELTHFCQGGAVSVNGLIHRLDLLSDIVSHNTVSVTSDATQKSDIWNLSVSIVIGRHWHDLLAVVFTEKSGLQQHDKYPNILYSLCCLWNKVLKCLLRNSSDSKENNLSIVLREFLGKTEILLNQMQSNAVPVLCRSKCLSVLLLSVPSSSSDTASDTNAVCFLNAAYIYLSTMMKIVVNPTSGSASMNRWVYKFLNIEDRSRTCEVNLTQKVQLRLDDETYTETSSSSNVVVGSQTCEVGVSNSLTQAAHPPHRTYEEGSFLCANGCRRPADKVLRKFVLLALRSLAVTAHAAITLEDVRRIIAVLAAVGTFIGDASVKLESSVADLFCDQDNYMFEALLCSLDVYSRCSKEASDVHVTHQLNSESHKMFEPHFLFVRLLEIICWDHMVLLDFVSSPETCALIYIARYLQYVLGDWSKFTNRMSSRKRTFSTGSESSDGRGSSAIDNGKKRAVCVSTDANSCLCVTCHGKPHLVEHCCVRSDVSCISTHHKEILLPHVFSSHSLVDYSSSSTASSPENNGYSLNCAGSPGKDELSSSSSSSLEESVISKDLDCSESDIFGSHTCNADTEESVLDRTMSFLIRFRLAVDRLIEKKLFPFNVRPLLKLLTQCEYLYDETV